jgi:NodT family efflux transporter outer membrane factor (OMF) lipoprotein
MKYAHLVYFLMLSACTLGPDFERPKVQTSSSYTAEGDTLSATDQHLDADKKVKKNWWTEFGCPQLNSVIETALTNNKDIIAAKATVAQAEEMVKATSGALWPQIDMDIIAGRQKYGVALFGPSNITIPVFTYYEVGPSLTMPLDIFGGEKRSIERQQALADYQTYELTATYLSLVSDVIAKSLSIAAIRAQISAYEEMIAIDEKYLQLVQKAHIAGATTRQDILAAQNQLQQDRSQLPLLYQHLSVARHALSILVGKAPADWVSPNFDLDQFILPHDLPIILPSELIHQRPDILAAEANLHAASAAIGVATANLYPQINLTGDFTQQALTPHELFHATSRAWSLTSNLLGPIFRGGTLAAEKRQAEAAYDEALAIYEKTVLTAFGDVANTLKALHHNGEEYTIQKTALDIAQNSLKLTQNAHVAGEVGALRIYETQRRYQQARLAYIRAKAQRYQDSAQFFAALGHV